MNIVETVKQTMRLHVSETFFDTTRVSSIAIALGRFLSGDAAPIGN